MKYLPVFAYGTLKQSESGGALIERWVTRRSPAIARGSWEETEAAYPGASSALPVTDIEGELVWFRADDLQQALRTLDAYEGVPALFERVKILVRTDDNEVEAYAYQWTGDRA